MTRVIQLTTLLLFIASHAAKAQGNPRQLTEGNSSSRSPSWSPDGSRIAFESDRNGNWDIYVLDVLTAQASVLTTSPASDRYPAWSPNGEHLVFVSDRQGEPDLHLLQLSSGQVHRLAPMRGEELFPAWSPDGHRIGFTLREEETFRLMTLSLENLLPTPLLPIPGRDLWLRWSPGGNRIVFFSRRDTEGEDDEIYLLKVPTGFLTRVTNRPGHDFCPAWNPEGTRLVFVSVNLDGTRALRVVDALGGSEVAQMAEGYHRVTEPSWSPDGRFIAYAAMPTPGGSYQLYVEPISWGRALTGEEGGGD